MPTVHQTHSDLIKIENQFALIGRKSVYVIRAAEVRRWKFGRSNASVLARFRMLQIASPVELELYGAICVPDNVKFEQALHAVLKPWHAHGEWFNEGDAVLAVANAMHAQDSIKVKALLLKLAEKQLLK